MRKYALILLLNMIFVTSIVAQNNEVVKLPEYYKGCGIVFSDSSKVHINGDFRSFFEPTVNEIQIGEEILKNDLKSFLRKKFIDTQKEYSLSEAELKQWEKTIENVDVKKQYKRYNRQYAGFINKSGERILLIRLLNFKSNKKLKSTLKIGKMKFRLGLVNFMKKIARCFL